MCSCEGIPVSAAERTRGELPKLGVDGAAAVPG